MQKAISEVSHQALIDRLRQLANSKNAYPLGEYWNGFEEAADALEKIDEGVKAWAIKSAGDEVMFASQLCQSKDAIWKDWVGLLLKSREEWERAGYFACPVTITERGEE